MWAWLTIEQTESTLKRNTPKLQNISIIQKGTEAKCSSPGAFGMDLMSWTPSETAGAVQTPSSHRSTVQCQEPENAHVLRAMDAEHAEQ